MNPSPVETSRRVPSAPDARARRVGPRLASRRRAGFTLIEIMITITLLAMLMGMAWGSYMSTERSQTYTKNINDRMHAAEQAMNRMVRELSMSFMTTHGLPQSELQPASGFSTDPNNPNNTTDPTVVAATTPSTDITALTNDPTKVVYRTGFYGDSDRIDFTCLCNVRMVRDEKTGDQAEISYFLKSVRRRDGSYVKSLVRRLDAPIDDKPRAGGFVMPLLEDVKSFKVEYWDDAKSDLSSGDDAWVSSWDTETSETRLRLPSRVRISLEIPHPNNANETITLSTQAEIHLTQAIDF